MEEMKQSEKSRVLEETVLLKTPAEITEMMEWLGDIQNSAYALGLACRFRGLEHVKALVDSGATFEYRNIGEDGQSYWTYNYRFGLLEVHTAISVSYRLDRRSLIFKDTDMIPDGKGGELPIKVLPIEQRAEIVRYLCENRDRAGFDIDELLFYSIMSDSRKITAVLNEYGAKFTEKRIEDLTENGRSFNWLEFCSMIDVLNNARFLPIMTQIVEQTGGKTLNYTDSIYYGNWSENKKKNKFFEPEFLRFILEHFDQKKMAKGRIMKNAIDLNSVECLELFAENGWLKLPKKRDEMIQYATEKGSTECTAYLLEFKNRTADLAAERDRAEKRMMAQLNADPNSVSEMKKIWSFEKLEDGSGLVIKRYKGNKTEIEIPEKIGKDTVTAIGDYAFSTYAPRLTRERSMFFDTVTRITLPGTIKVIGEAAFYFLKNLKEVNIPDGVEKIGERAFDCCMALTSLELPDSVKELGAKTFSGSKNLEYVKLPDGITEIGDYMFSNCQGLKEITIPDSVKRIGIWAFRTCKALEEIVLPEGVEEIAREAFVDCDNLARVVLPGSIKLIKNYRSPPETPFHNSPNVEAVVVPKSYAEKYCKRNNIPYISGSER